MKQKTLKLIIKNWCNLYFWPREKSAQKQNKGHETKRTTTITITIRTTNRCGIIKTQEEVKENPNTVKYLPALLRPGPKRRGICLITASDARKAWYFFASFFTSFLFLFSFFKPSTSIYSRPILSAWRHS